MKGRFSEVNYNPYQISIIKPDVGVTSQSLSITKSRSLTFTLEPDEVFAYHDNVLPEFKEDLVVTMNSRFYVEEGYKSLAGLGGNGVCHLASLINWTAQEADLEVTAKTNHNFAPIPGVPKEYGTSIRYAEVGHNSQNQNLYIKNGFDEPVTFEFEADNEKVTLVITK